MSDIIKIEEFEQEGNIYIREIYENGAIVEFLKSENVPTSSNYQELKQPTNVEVMQAISDLQADLIIAGVL
jgi:hypothetical protein